MRHFSSWFQLLQRRGSVHEGGGGVVTGGNTFCGRGGHSALAPEQVELEGQPTNHIAPSEGGSAGGRTMALCQFES